MSKLPIGVDIDILIDDLKSYSWESSDILHYYFNTLKDPKIKSNILENKDEENKLTLGSAFRNTSMVLYGETIEDFASRPNAPIESDMFETIRSFFEETMNSPVRVTAIMDAGDSWKIEVELVEEKEYTQKYGRDQLIGIYEATMNKDQKITSYQRMNTRPRSTPFEKKER